ncbi:MAG TPA: type II toxin-antitoxin system HipA family toxin [Solirubrobacteraceae bacterium]|jgi:serine/threonine-protein kinase HipA|nr:type II toxin-antitoxin system HipA family toxin [Solirubrobacteraceae bacterium]
MTLGVYWDGREVGLLRRVSERNRDYTFSYTDTSRAISLSLPTARPSFESAETRPFFEALLPEGAVREQVAAQLKLAASDSFGLLSEIGGDCAGALQIVEAERVSEVPTVAWLDQQDLDQLVDELPRYPLGLHGGDRRLRLSLAGVQAKAVLVRDSDGWFGKPLDGMASTHILKPERTGGEYPGLAANEHFCMLLATRCGLSAAPVALQSIAGRPCLIVERFDRDLSSWPPRRIHQEDLCQALGITPDFKYQHEGWRLPSYRALAGLLDEHSPAPGVDRLAGALSAVFHYLVGNADAHAKNVSLLHGDDGVRLAPLYDIVCTAAYADLDTNLALGIGDEFDPEKITSLHWADLAADFGLSARAFERARGKLVERVVEQASVLPEQARRDGWHHDCLDRILDVIAERASCVA